MIRLCFIVLTLSLNSFDLQLDDVSKTAMQHTLLQQYREKAEERLLVPRQPDFQIPMQPPEPVKPVITPEKWREFCAETVILAKIPKRNWTDDETFHADLYVSHNGDYRIADATVFSNLIDDNESNLQHENVSVGKIEPGFRGKVAEITFDLSKSEYLETPTSINVEIMLRFPGKRNPLCPNTNHYTIWVYSSKLDPGKTLREFEKSGGLVSNWNEKFAMKKDAVQNGKTVLEFAPHANESTWPEESPHVESIVCEPGHPALKLFPTERFAGKQWERLLKNAMPVPLEDLPKELTPIVRLANSRDGGKRGILFEGKIQSGKLLVCGIPLSKLKELPEGKQFLESLIRYVLSKEFDPKVELPTTILERQ